MLMTTLPTLANEDPRARGVGLPCKHKDQSANSEGRAGAKGPGGRTLRSPHRASSEETPNTETQVQFQRETERRPTNSGHWERAGKGRLPIW